MSRPAALIDMADLPVGHRQIRYRARRADRRGRRAGAAGRRPHGYAKFTALSADDWPAVGVAVWCPIADGRVAEARVAVSAATERPGRVAGAEAALTGAAPDAKAIAAAADAAAAGVEPLTDLRGSAAYEREMAGCTCGARSRGRSRTREREAEDVHTPARARGRHDHPRRPTAARARLSAKVGRPMRAAGEHRQGGRERRVHPPPRIPGMLTGRICRSTVPHGRIVRIDATAALALEGVHAVITGEDVRKVLPHPYFGPAFHDQPVLALDKVRFVGEPVAVVLARDARTAEEAAALVDVEYEELPAVFDAVEAAGPAPRCCTTSCGPGSTFADLKHLSGGARHERGPRVPAAPGRRRRRASPACRTSSRTASRTPAVAHAPLEPLVAIGRVADDGGLIIDSATQNPSIVRLEVARLFELPEAKVQIRTAFLGGGFGAKLYPKLEPLVAACAVITGRPVRLALSMDETFLTITRHGSTIAITSGVDADGIVRARKVEAWWNGGAYADIGPRVTQKSGLTAAGPYDIDNVRIDSRAVYTNLPPAGAMRGFGVPQVAFAYERHTDLMAARARPGPGRLPPPQPPAARGGAPHRHRARGHRERGGARGAGPGHGVGPPARPAAPGRSGAAAASRSP